MNVLIAFQETYFDRKFLQRCTLNDVDSQLVVRVNGCEATGDCKGLSQPKRDQENEVQDIPKNFCVPLDSIISTTPGRKGSIDGTWLERIPMSPDSAGMFTWTTS